MKAVPVAINLIRISAESQSRAATDRRTVEEYAQAWKSEAEFPPVDLFAACGEYFPGDGIHRILAAKLAGRAAILAYVYRGDAREAFLHGCASNQTHGLRRTNVDKRHMVCRMLNDPEWVGWSDRRIAEQCGVSAQFVTNLRHELSTVDGSAVCRHADSPRLGADGKLRKPPASNGFRQSSAANSTVKMTKPLLVGRRNQANTEIAHRREDLDALQREVTVVLRRLEELLSALDMYDCCVHELQSIHERMRKLNLAGMSA